MKFLSMLLGCCLILSSCSEKDPLLVPNPKEEKDPLLVPPEREQASAQKKSKQQEVRTNLVTEPPTLDPRQQLTESSDGLIRMLFSGLTFQDRDHSTKLALAASYGVSRDQKTYTFFLKEIRWSDGTNLTAHDFEETWKGMCDPSFAGAVDPLYVIKGARRAKLGEIPAAAVAVRALDPQTLVIELDHPLPAFLDMLASPPFYPVHHTMRKGAVDFDHFISCGPFRLLSNPPRDQIVVEKNPYYWDSSDVRIDRIYYYILSDEEMARTMFENGELDCLSQLSSELAFNTAKFPFHNEAIRQALITIFDQQKAEELFTQGLSELGIDRHQFPEITLTYGPLESMQVAAQALQKRWEDRLGIRVTLSQEKTGEVAFQGHTHPALKDVYFTPNGSLDFRWAHKE